MRKRVPADLDLNQFPEYDNQAREKMNAKAAELRLNREDELEKQESKASESPSGERRGQRR